MANKTPLRAVFNASDVATGLAEFQSGDTIPLLHGGIGVALSIGSAGQVLKVNSGASALEFGAVEAIVNIDNATNLTSATLATGDQILISDGGTEGRATLAQIDTLFSGTSKTLTNKTLTSPVINTGVSGTAILDEDNMASDSATQLSTQQSIKAYVDTELGNVSTTSIATGNSNVTVVDSGTGNVTIEVDGTDRITTVAATTTTATGHSLVMGAASSTVGGQIKFLEGTNNGTNGVTLQGPASTADVTVTLPAAADTLVGKATTDTLTNKSIDLATNTITGSLAEFNSALQSESFASLTGSETLTNKTLTTPVLTTPIANAGIQLKNAATSAGFVEFFEDSDNGTNKVTLIGPASTANVTVTLPAVTGTVITTANSDGAATTTSSSDADFVLVDDGGVMKKITTTNLGIVNSLGIEGSSFLTAPGTDGNFDLAKIEAQTGSAESGLTTNAVDAFAIPTGSSPDQFDCMDPKFQTDTVDYGVGEAHVGA
jgi:hypothetical protein